MPATRRHNRPRSYRRTGVLNRGRRDSNLNPRRCQTKNAAYLGWWRSVRSHLASAFDSLFRWNKIGTMYAELQVTTHFSFLRGASSCEELFAQAAFLGIPALGIVDRHSLAGVVRAHEASKATGVRSIVGCRLDLTTGETVLVYPTDRAAYRRLCRLLTLGKSRAGKGACALGWADLVAHADGQIVVLVPDEPDEDCADALARVARAEIGRAHV